jgi:hypothetical protein
MFDFARRMGAKARWTRASTFGHMTDRRALFDRVFVLRDQAS